MRTIKFEDCPSIEIWQTRIYRVYDSKSKENEYDLLGLVKEIIWDCHDSQHSIAILKYFLQSITSAQRFELFSHLVQEINDSILTQIGYEPINYPIVERLKIDESEFGQKKE